MLELVASMLPVASGARQAGETGQNWSIYGAPLQH